MSVLIRFSPDSGASPTTTEQYDEAVRRLQESGDFPPQGMEYHVSFIKDGSVRVSEIWDSREQLESFGQRLMPILEEVGINPGDPEILEIHNIISR